MGLSAELVVTTLDGVFVGVLTRAMLERAAQAA